MLPHPTTDRDAARAGLSTELRRLLSLPGLDGADSGVSSPLGAPVDLTLQYRDLSDRTAERQYYWLERFHQHLEREQQSNKEQPGSMSLPARIGLEDNATMSAQSMPAARQSQSSPFAPENPQCTTIALAGSNLV
jgi:hypothetical protein